LAIATPNVSLIIRAGEFCNSHERLEKVTNHFSGGSFATVSRYVCYSRVSTVRQGHSGLGLEAQQTALLRFLPRNAVRVADYVEVESGRKSARPQLLAAIAQAQQEYAVLLVAKLDRLARSVAFLAP
jgi:hypothetical protein